MKKIFFIVVIIATAFVQQSFAQDSTAQPSQLLQSYFNIKNALVAGNAGSASSGAGDFIKALNSTDNKMIAENNAASLHKNASAISASKNLIEQRLLFASLSTNLYALAKTVKLNTHPVYYDYCPMKKTYWLSSDKAIKNPYFGSAMLTCGKVTETIE